jgi:membrane-associated HD superfamily phosphohydrolase
MGLRPRFKTPFSQARDKLIAYAMRPLMVVKPRTRFLIACSVLVLATTLLLLNTHSTGLNENYKEGDVLSRTIVVPADITAVDLAETERRKAAARETARPVFNFDSSRTETSVQSFVAGWQELKEKVAPNQDINESEIDRLSSIIRSVGEGYIYDDGDAKAFGPL